MALEISEIGIHVRVPDGQPAPAAGGRHGAGAAGAGRQEPHPMSAQAQPHAHGHGHGHGGGPVTMLPPGAHFDEIAALYNASLPPHVVRHYLRKRVRFVRDRLPPPARVLDVGLVQIHAEARS